MANEIKDKFGTSTALTCTLLSLADAAARQSTFVDNGTDRWQDIDIHLELKTIGTAVGNSTIEVYALKADKHTTPNVTTDGAGTTDAAITIVNADLLGTLKLTAAGGIQTLQRDFFFHRPGPSWAIAVKNNTGAALDATEANHVKQYVGHNPEVQ